MPRSSRHRSHRSHRRGRSADRSESEGGESAPVAGAREEASAAATVSRDPEPERRRSSSGKEAVRPGKKRKRRVDEAVVDVVGNTRKGGVEEAAKHGKKRKGRVEEAAEHRKKRKGRVEEAVVDVVGKKMEGCDDHLVDKRSKSETFGHAEVEKLANKSRGSGDESKRSSRRAVVVDDRAEEVAAKSDSGERRSEKEKFSGRKESTGHYKDDRDREREKDRDRERDRERERERGRLKKQERDKKDYDSKHERYEDGSSRKCGLMMSRTEEEAYSYSGDPDVNGSEDTDFSSPPRRPKSLLVEKTTTNGEIIYEYNSEQEAVDAYHKSLRKYHKKLARQQQLPTLKQSNYGRNVTDWDNLKQKNVILDAAESVLRLSSSQDGKEINSCNGTIFEWDESDQSAIVVTSSQIISTKVSLDDWEDNNVYAPNAKVTAHLLDGTTSEMTLLYFSKHYEVAFFKVMGPSKLQVASLEPELEFGSKACVLAREKDLGLICRRTKILALDPCDHQRNHYLFIGGSVPESCTGGLLADFNRKVVGMVVNALPNFAFIPSSIIIRCFRLWKSCKIIARPHLGLKLRTVQFLDITHLEQLSRDFKIKVGLIVGKVSSESLAERNGFRTGDVIFSCKGKSVSTISEFEGTLLDICEKQFEKGNGLTGEVDVEIGVHRLRKPAMRRMVTLSVKLSDCMEVFDY